MLALPEQGPVDASVLVDGDRSLAGIARREQAQLAAALLRREALLLVSRFHPAALGNDPDLQEVHGLGFGGVELAVHHPATRAHALDVSGLDHASPSGGIAMRETAVEDVGDDLHVAVQMGTEALSGLDRVVVDHAQGPEAGTVWVVVVRERERMPGIEPIGPGMEAIVGLENADHRFPQLDRCGRLPQARRRMRDYPARFESWQVQGAALSS